MFPYIDSQHDRLTFHDRRILVRRRRDFQLAVRACQPCPARTETRHAGGGEFFLEGVEAAESRRDVGCERFGRRATARSQDGPEHRVVPVSAAIIADCSADAFGHGDQIARQQLFERLIRQFGRGFERLV